LQSQQRQNLRQKTKLLQPSRLPVGDQARKWIGGWLQIVVNKTEN
jgi:hypothetical protein